MVDTQCDLAHARRLIELIGSVDPAPARFVINTHEDADHVWGNQLFPNAEIIAHQRVPDRMREVADPRPIRRLVRGVDQFLVRWYLRKWHAGIFAAGKQLREDYDFEGIKLVVPTTLFEDRFELDLDGLEVHTQYVGPCHQVGDAIVHVPSERVLFAGDIVFNDCTPIGWAGTFQNWLDALDLIVELNPEYIVPGHGPVCGLEGISEMKSFLEHAWEESKACFDQGVNAIEASKRIDFGRFGKWHSPARLYMSVERAYREFRGQPLDWPWNIVSAFDSIYEVAEARGIDTAFWVGDRVGLLQSTVNSTIRPLVSKSSLNAILTCT